MAAANRGTTAAVSAPLTVTTEPPAPAVPAAAATRPHDEWSLKHRLLHEGFAFDFFQAVRVLARLDPKRHPVGHAVSPRQEVVRFRSHLSLTFPPSSIYDIVPPSETVPAPLMTVSFFGLTGPSGILPRHYTELLLRIDREGKWVEKNALRDWLALFDHRLISLFYRAWEKYRFVIPYERREYERPDPDPFTRCLFSLIGFGLPPLRNRLAVSVHELVDERETERQLAHIDDLALLHFSGFLAHRPRCAVALEALLQDFFQLPLSVRQFQGQWLVLDRGNQSQLGEANAGLGVDLVVGERVWDVQGKIRIRLGPLRYGPFAEYLPDRTVIPQRKALFLLSHLVRLYIGPELDFDVQLILTKEDVPACHLGEGGLGPRLGWNTWLCSRPAQNDAEDVVFDGDELRWLDEPIGL
jgi:type VI secretion system protein ImpH